MNDGEVRRSTLVRGVEKACAGALAISLGVFDNLGSLARFAGKPETDIHPRKSPQRLPIQCVRIGLDQNWSHFDGNAYGNC